MKTKTPPAKQARLPKAELVKAGFIPTHISAKQNRAVIYCPTQKAARALVKWHGLTREEKRDAISELCGLEIASAYFRGQLGMNVISDEREDYKLTDAILALMEGKR